MKKQGAERKGFTLVELLVYVGLVTVAISIITTFFVDVTKNAAEARAVKEVNQNARLLLSRVTSEIRNADSIVDAGSGQLDLRDDEGRSVMFALNGDDVMVTTDGVSEQLTGSNVCVTQLDFAFGAPSNTVSVNVTVRPQATCGEPVNGMTLSTSVVPRHLLF